MREGQSIGRFRVERLLGEGGIAQVFQVRHRQLGTLHALKLLTVNSSALADRLLQEGRIQANIRHPNLVGVTDVVEHGGQIGLVMEYVEGFSLDDCLAEGRMDLNEVIDLFGQVLAGVGTAHAAGVLHRDLKPGNILLTTKDEQVIAKVADFGIAKMTHVEGRTVGGTTMGTPGYMAPEQISDAKTVDARADIFALGTILYEMVSGRRAFLGSNMLDTLNRTAEGRYTPLRQLVPDCPAELATAVDRALRTDPDQRFPDCEAFLRALELRPDTITRSPSLEPIDLPVREDGPNPTLAPAAHTWTEPPEPQPEPETEPPPQAEPEATPSQAPTEQARPADLDELNARWGLTDVQVDESLPPMPRKPSSSEPQRRPEPVSSPPDLEEPEDPTAEDPTRHFRPDGGSDIFAELVWPVLRALYHTGRYFTLPVVIVLLAGGAGAMKGERQLQVLEEQVQTAEVQLDQAVAGQQDMVAELVALGARPSILDPYVERLKRAEDERSRFEAAAELTGAMLEELRLLPATDDPAQVQKRREAEMKLNHASERYQSYLEAMDGWQAGAGTMTGTLAIRAGFAEAPPDWTDE